MKKCTLPGGEVFIGSHLNQVLPPYNKDIERPLRDRLPYYSITYNCEGLVLVEWGINLKEQSGLVKLTTVLLDSYPENNSCFDLEPRNHDLSLY